MNPIRQKQLNSILKQIEPLQFQLRDIHKDEQIEFFKMLEVRQNGEDGNKSGAAISQLEAAIETLEYLIDHIQRAELGNDDNEPTEHMKAVLQRRHLDRELQDHESAFSQMGREKREVTP
jgi:ArsR family metal-binding transcriptional regulator